MRTINRMLARVKCDANRQQIIAFLSRYDRPTQPVSDNPVMRGAAPKIIRRKAK